MEVSCPKIQPRQHGVSLRASQAYFETGKANDIVEPAVSMNNIRADLLERAAAHGSYSRYLLLYSNSLA